MTSEAVFLKAKKDLAQLLPDEATLKSKLKDITKKTNPLRKLIKKYMEEKQIQEVKVGSTLFKLQQKVAVSFTKKSFMTSQVISNQKKKAYINENKSRVISVSEKLTK